MRIISGSFKGRRFEAPSNLPVRPTTDMAREALFNILRNLIDFEEVRVLDLCAGIGSVSFEFCSRGAAAVTAVDKHAPCVDFIRQQAAAWQMSQLSVVKQDVCEFLKPVGCSVGGAASNANGGRVVLGPTASGSATAGSAAFDLVFADPPYDAPFLAQLPDLVGASSRLKHGGYFILEHGKEHSFAQRPDFEQERHYGKVRFSFFRQA